MAKLKFAIVLAINLLGIVFGAFLFYIGLFASSSIGATAPFGAYIEWICWYMAILPIAVLAFWKPRISAILFACCVTVSVSYGLAGHGAHGLHKLVAFYTPRFALIAGYFWSASVESARDSADRP